MNRKKGFCGVVNVKADFAFVPIVAYNCLINKIEF